MISIYVVAWILVWHWCGDFVLQTDWQAKNKSSNTFALLKHVGSYSIVILIMSLFILHPIAAVIYTITNAALHFETDFWTSRLNSYLWKKGEVHNFFVSVGFDQLIHYACLFGLYMAFNLV